MPIYLIFSCAVSLSGVDMGCQSTDDHVYRTLGDCQKARASLPPPSLDNLSAHGWVCATGEVTNGWRLAEDGQVAVRKQP
jgi:hypothetical protein